MSKPKAGALGLKPWLPMEPWMGETIISVGRTGLFLRLGAAPAGLVILAIRYTQGSAALHPGLTYFALSELISIADDWGNRHFI